MGSETDQGKTIVYLVVRESPNGEFDTFYEWQPETYTQAWVALMLISELQSKIIGFINKEKNVTIRRQAH